MVDVGESIPIGNMGNEVGDPIAAAGSFDGQPVGGGSSPIEPRNNPLYGPLEKEIFQSLSKAKRPEATTAQRTRSAEAELAVGIDFGEPIPIGTLDEAAPSEEPTTDVAGRTYFQREILDRFRDKVYNYENREVTLGEMRVGHHYYRRIKDLWQKRSGLSPEEFTDALVQNKEGMDTRLQQHARFLAAKYPDSPNVERVGTTAYATAKLIPDMVPALFSLNETVAGFMVRLFHDFFTDPEPYDKIYRSKKDAKGKIQDPGYFLKPLAQNFEEWSGDFYGDSGFSMRDARPHIMDAFRFEELELPPDYAEIVMGLDSPSSNMASYMVHYLGTGVPFTMGSVGVRLALRSRTSNKLNKFAAGRGIKDIRKLEGEQMGALVDDFVAAQTAKRFPIPVISPMLRNMKNNRLRQRIIAREYAAERKSQRQKFYADAEKQGISVNALMKQRLHKPTQELRKLQRDPKATQEQINEAMYKVQNIALENLLGRRFGIHVNLKGKGPKVQITKGSILPQDPVIREEIWAEILFSTGATLYDAIRKSENYSGSDTAMSTVSGFALLLLGQRSLPRHTKQLEGMLRETYMNVRIAMRHSTLLTSKAKGKASAEMMDIPGAFSPEVSVRLGQGNPIGAVSPDKSVYYPRVKGENWTSLEPEARQTLEKLMAGMKLAGAADDTIKEIEKIDGYRRTFERITGNSNDFDSSFGAIVALQPLLALQDTAKISLTGTLGSIKVKELQQHVGLALEAVKILDSAKKGFENLSPQRLQELGIDDPELLDMVNVLLRTRAAFDDFLGGYVSALDAHLVQAQENFARNQGTHIDQSTSVQQASGILDQAATNLAEIKASRGIVDTPEGGRLSVAEEQLTAARQATEDVNIPLREQKRLLSSAGTKASALQAGVRTPRFKEDNTNHVVHSLIESGKLEEALFELAMNVRNAKVNNYNEQFKNLYAGIDVPIDDSGFMGEILAQWTRISYGKDLTDTLKTLTRQEPLPSDLRPIVGAIESSSGRKLDEYYASLGDIEGQIARDADRADFFEQFPNSPVAYNWLILKGLQGAGKVPQGLKWNLHDLDLLRRALNDRAGNLEGEAATLMRTLADNVNETVTETLLKARNGKKLVQKREVLRTRYRREIRGGLYESKIGKLVHQANTHSGFLPEGTLIKEFDLNRTLYGNDRQYAEFVERLQRFFGDAKDTPKGEPDQYILNPSTITRGGDNIEIKTGRILKSILSSMNHAAMIKSTVLKNNNLETNGVKGFSDQKEVQRNLYDNVTGLDSEAVKRLALLEGRMGGEDGMGDFIWDAATKDFTTTLNKLVGSSAAVKKAFAEAESAIKILARNTSGIQKGVDNLTKDIIEVTASNVFAGKQLVDLDDFIERFGGRNNSLVEDVPQLMTDIAYGLKNSTNPRHKQYANMNVQKLRAFVKEALLEKVIRKIGDDTFGVAGKDTATIIKLGEYDPDALIKFIDEHEGLYRALLPDNLDRKTARVKIFDPERGGNIEVLKDNYMELLKEFGETVKFLQFKGGVQTPKGILAYATKGLSPSSWVSRIYAVDRGVVSPRYVLTEALLVKYRMKKGQELQNILRDPELLFYMNKILQTKNVLPKEMNRPFQLALRRAIAHNNNSTAVPDSKDLGITTDQEIEQFEQNIMAQSAGAGGDLVPQTRMAGYTTIPTEVMPGQPS